MSNRVFLVTTAAAPEGVQYTYTEDGLFVGVEIKQANMAAGTRQSIINKLQLSLNECLSYFKTRACTVVELQQEITFAMFWDKYSDKQRSSRKRTEKLWNKLSEADHVKAFYYIETYNRHRGNAEKKYAETYLSDELWNN